MSSILKALKKLEEQKAPRPQYELDLSSGIMRERKRGRQRRWVIPAGMAAVAVAAIISTYGVMQLRQHSAPETSTPIQTAPATAPTLPRESDTALPQVTGKPEATHRESTIASQSTVTTPSPVTVAADSRKVPPPARQQLTAAKAPDSKVGPAAQAGPPTSPAVVSPHPSEQESAPAERFPKLKLSGIAWQQDSASRYAVVNGVAVSEGSTIDGARIEEILPDKVRFSMAGRSFEVAMGHLPPSN